MSLTSRRLPASWVNKIFQEMQGHYGTRWGNLWKTGVLTDDGQDAGILNAMDTWAEKLGGFHDEPERIKVVLNALPSDPPSLPAFISMLRAVHVENCARIAYKLSEEEIERNRARLKDLLDKLTHGKKIEP